MDKSEFNKFCKEWMRFAIIEKKEIAKEIMGTTIYFLPKTYYRSKNKYVIIFNQTHMEFTLGKLFNFIKKSNEYNKSK